MEPSVRGLRAFTAVARHSHFGRAAEELHISGPALSQLIRRLEREVDATLFQRSTRSVVLTSAGSELLPHAVRVVEALDSLTAWTREQAAGSRRRVVLGFTVNGAGQLMSRLLADVRRELPDIEVLPKQVAWTEVARCVRDGTHDVVIARGPRHLPGVRFQPVRTEPWVAVVPDGHDLALAGTASFTDLTRYPMLRPELAPGERRPRWLGGPDAHGVAPPAGPVTSTLEEALDHVLMGSGVFLTGASVATLYPRAGVAYVPLTGLRRGFIGLITDPSRHSSTIDSFVRVAAASAASD